MTNQEKMEALKKWLQNKRIEHWVNVTQQEKDIFIDVYLPRYLMAIRIDGEDSPAWFKGVKYYLFPVFIRDADTSEFVIEKVQNTMERVINIFKKAAERKKRPNKKLPSAAVRKYIRHLRNRRHRFVAGLVAEQKFCMPPRKNNPKVKKVKARKRFKITAVPIKKPAPS